MDALGGCHGPAYDKILLNSGMIDYHLGFCESASEGIQQARKALDSGSALSSLNRYIDVTNELK